MNKPEESNNEKGRIQKVAEATKKHVSKNWKIYAGIGGGLLVGATGAILMANSTNLVTNKQVQVLTWKSKQMIEVFVEALGDPGNIIQDTTTGIIYASQGQAARELGLSPARISDQLNGRTTHVMGHVFEKLGKAGVAE